MPDTATPPSPLTPGAAASTRTITVATPVYALSVLAIVTLAPGAVRPGASSWLAVAGGAVLLVGSLSLLQVSRTGRTPGWWALSFLAAVVVAGTSLADDQLRQVAAIALAVVPMTTTMDGRGRAAVRQLYLAAALGAALAAVGEGVLVLRVLRAFTTAAVIVVFVLGLLVLRARLDAALARADQLSTHDPLTGLLNRRGLEERFAALLTDGRRDGSTVCVVLADLDHFKVVNDSHGYEAGDRLLVDVAAAVVGATRPGDLVVRHGGEELVVVAPVAGPEAVPVLAERVRRSIALLPVLPRATASIGAIGVMPGADLQQHPHRLLAQMVAQADALMYRAKLAGRDRAVSEVQRVSTGA